VLVFVLLGRQAHDSGRNVLGTLATAWPFLAGAAAGWLVVRGRRLDPAGLTAGAVVAMATVVLGMTLRHLTGGGVQPSFVAVASAFLALFLLGWRVLALRLARRKAARPVTATR
jgi:peptidoglycan/LPS O-acetylase OafA/YrhL